MDWTELPELFRELDSPARWLPLLRRHYQLLFDAESHTRVTSVAPEDAVRRQYAESLETWRIAVEASGELPAHVVDVGSGGGFPGLVMACVAPGVEFALVEPLQKRARLLETVAAALGLTNVSVHAQRAEEAGRGPLRDSASLVTARAVAALPELLEYTAPLCAPDGLLVLPKGSGFETELAAAETAMAELAVSWLSTVPMRPGISETVRIAIFAKHAATSKRYPRRPGLPRKRPL